MTDLILWWVGLVVSLLGLFQLLGRVILWSIDFFAHVYRSVDRILDYHLHREEFERWKRERSIRRAQQEDDR